MHLHGVRVGGGEPCTSSAERALAVAVVDRAIRDLAIVRYRGAALAWLRDGAAAWLEPLGIDQEQMLAEINSRSGPGEPVLTPARAAVLRAIGELEAGGEKATAAAANALTGACSADYHIPRLRQAGLVEQVGERGGCRLTETGRAAVWACGQ